MRRTLALSTVDMIFILVLGSDSRPGTPVDQGLCDSIHILGIDAWVLYLLNPVAVIVLGFQRADTAFLLALALTLIPLRVLAEVTA